MYPVLLTDDVPGRGFFVGHVGFGERFESDWYVSLVHGENDAYESGIVSHDHETISEDFRRPTGAL